jgi:hypothetical protein
MTDDEALALAPAHALDPEKPRLSRQQRQRAQEAEERLWDRPIHPGVALAQREGRWEPESPWADEDEAAWHALVFDALGTRSQAVVSAFIANLQALVGEWHDGQRWRPDENALTAALSMVATAKPQNELEAALCAQMVAVHLLTMRVAGQALGNGYVEPRSAIMTAKLALTFARQSEALAKVQGRVRAQEITVRYERHEHRHFHDEKHVHVRDGGSGEIRDQAHEPCLEAEKRPALPGPDAPRDPVPVPCRERPQAVHQARRRARFRRSEG